MMGNLAFDMPALLWLLPFALLPVASSLFAGEAYPSLAVAPRDTLSILVNAIIKFAGIAAIAAIILGLAGPHSHEHSIWKTGRGAHIVMLIDRSSSMDNTFAGKRPSGEEESKSIAARRILMNFVKERRRDEMGVVVFSTAPMLSVPLTLNHEAVASAVDAIGRPGLAYTNVGLGLAMALAQFEERHQGVPHTVLLVSDGAALIERHVQRALEGAFRRNRVHLYWLFLRTTNSPGLFPQSGEEREVKPQAMPERYLHKFFSGLGIPYRVFQAENASSIKEAVAEIGRLEASPIRYRQRVPRRDYADIVYGTAAVAVLLLLLAKLSETRLSRPSSIGKGRAVA